MTTSHCFKMTTGGRGGNTSNGPFCKFSFNKGKQIRAMLYIYMNIRICSLKDYKLNQLYFSNLLHLSSVTHRYSHQPADRR